MSCSMSPPFFSISLHRGAGEARMEGQVELNPG